MASPGCGAISSPNGGASHGWVASGTSGGHYASLALVCDQPSAIRERCAVLLAEACNVGLTPLIHLAIPALTRERFSWVQQNYLRAETLTRAKEEYTVKREKTGC